MPRGLGRATATTSAAFFPHSEQRIRCASASSIVDQPTRCARAHAHQEPPEAVIQLLDVSEHSHPVNGAEGRFQASMQC